jgi:hypothetical protein
VVKEHKGKNAKSEPEQVHKSNSNFTFAPDRLHPDGNALLHDGNAQLHGSSKAVEDSSGHDGHSGHNTKTRQWLAQ